MIVLIRDKVITSEPCQLNKYGFNEHNLDKIEVGNHYFSDPIDIVSQYPGVILEVTDLSRLIFIVWLGSTLNKYDKLWCSDNFLKLNVRVIFHVIDRQLDQRQPFNHATK